MDPETEVLVLNGTREGLFLGAIAAKRYVPQRAGRPAILIPNPFYAAYSAGAAAAECEPVYLPATRATGFLPDLDALDEALLKRTVAFYIASPSNPQGAVAELAYLKRIVALARRHGFLVFADECYCEIYLNGRPPRGMLEASAPDFTNVVVFHSLSKRSNLPGLRVGFAAGDRRFLARYSSCATSRRRRCRCRRRKSRSRPTATSRTSRTTASSTSPSSISPTRSSAIATAISGRPAASSSGSTSAPRAATSWSASKLWRDGGLRVIPGRYLARDGADGRNPGAGLYPRRAGSRQGNHGRGAAPPRAMCWARA